MLLPRKVTSIAGVLYHVGTWFSHSAPPMVASVVLFEHKDGKRGSQASARLLENRAFLKGWGGGGPVFRHELAIRTQPMGRSKSQPLQNVKTMPIWFLTPKSLGLIHQQFLPPNTSIKPNILQSIKIFVPAAPLTLTGHNNAPSRTAQFSKRLLTTKQMSVSVGSSPRATLHAFEAKSLPWHTLTTAQTERPENGFERSLLSGTEVGRWDVRVVRRRLLWRNRKHSEQCLRATASVLLSVRPRMLRRRYLD